MMKKLGGHLFDNYSVNMSDEQRKAMRMDYDTKFLSRDAQGRFVYYSTQRN